MKPIKLLLCFLVITLSSNIHAQTDYSWKEGKSNGYTYRYVSNDPMKARFYTLKNGLMVILTENRLLPRIAVNIAVRAGSNTDPITHTGLAHYLEHLLFKGTDKFGTLNWEKERPYIDSITALYERYTKMTDPEERKKTYKEIDRLSGEASKYAIANEYDKLMSQIGSQGTNAHTWYEETVYEEDIPSNSLDKFLTIQSERFRNPVFRLFHTELEAVYEEKNRSLDNDGNKVREKLMDALFPTTNYGQQTTIGTIEDLKNPSINAIRNYYNTYYVPNNMAIIMAGDFNSDEVIKKIDQAFQYMQKKPLKLYEPAPEKPLTAIISKEVFGPTAENINISFRTPAVNTHDALILDLISDILNNGSAGLMDINLNKSQKVQYSRAFLNQMKDYGVFSLIGGPKEGQSLDDVAALLLSQIDKIKKGDFDESLIKAIVANSKLNQLEGLDKNANRLNQLMESFILTRGEKWDADVSALQSLSKVKKAEVMAVANKYFGDNYVVVKKRRGEDKNIVKVEKPPITPVETNAGLMSPFVEAMSKIKSPDIQPVWIDYSNQIQKSNDRIAEILYTPNKDNELFSLYYQFDMGGWNDPQLSYAAQYLQYLNTDKMSATEISKAFYDIACDYRISVGDETTTISITGLQQNFDKAVKLFEEILRNCKADEEALSVLKARWFKSRADAKLNKSQIVRGLMNYAEYGKVNPFNSGLTDKQLNDLSAQGLVDQLHNLLNYKHKVIYFGPQSLDSFRTSISKMHYLPKSFTAYPASKKFEFVKQNRNKILFSDYDMVQSEIYWIRNLGPYDFKKEAEINVFNNYFGGGMGGVVFQTIRESKALAYSTFANYGIPSKKENPFIGMAYVGCQADKMPEAINAMNELLNNLPASQQRFDLALAGVKKNIQTQRISKQNIIFSYLNAEKKGFDKDMRKDMYEQLNALTPADINNLHKDNLADKPYTYFVVASKDKINMDVLKNIGEVEELSLEEIFGY